MKQLECENVRVELAILHAVETLPTKHQLAIQREKDGMDDDRRRMSAWIHDVKDSCDKNKKYMEEHLAEKEGHVPEMGGALDQTTHASTERPEDSSTEQDTTIDPRTDPVVEGSKVETCETVTPFTEGVPCSEIAGWTAEHQLYQLKLPLD